MKTILVVAISLSLFSFFLKPTENNLMKENSFYDLKSTTIDGDAYNFSALKGKKVLIVNTASKCGYTPQYEQLQELYNKFGGENFEIIGFPSNDFGKQEPGSEEEIKAFCKKNYGVSFTMMSKVEVKGNEICEVYNWLTSRKLNGVMDSEVQWNFQKYLVDENGKLFKMLSSGVSPLDDQIITFIEG